MFKKASKKQSKLRLALIGVSGSGKTYTSLKVASFLGDKIAVVDTEHGSASKYSDEFEFDVCELDNFSPQNYINAIKEAEAAGYEALVIDSLSHAWTGEGGALQMVNDASKRMKGNSYMAWGDVTPIQNRLIETMIASKMHLIVTMRAKTEYVTELVNGKNVPKKIGMAPVQREGMEYEFDVVGDLDTENNFIVSKTRIRSLSGVVIQKPGKELADTLKAWLEDGEAPVLQQADPSKGWKSPQDAIDWAAKELEISIEDADLLYQRTEPDEKGRKGKPFKEAVLAMKAE